MRFYIKNIYLILLIIISFLNGNEGFAKETKIKYFKKNISNYFSGTVSSKYSHYDNAYEYLDKIKNLSTNHDNYKVTFLNTLIQLGKFDEAFNFSKNIWNKEELFFEVELIMGLNFFLNENYSKAEMHFRRLSKIPRYDIFSSDIFENILNAWVKAAEKNKIDSFNYINKIPNRYMHLKQIQDSFMKCYYDSKETENSFTKLIESENYNFSRYNFFLINYFLHENKINKAKEIVKISREKYNSNLIIKETENFLLENKIEKIKKIFDCKNPKHAIAEFFYIISNLYSSEEDYKKSNFFLNISLFLNKQFEPNKALLAENFYYQKKFKEAKNIYDSLKSFGLSYSWHSSKGIASILDNTSGAEESIIYLKKNFNFIKNKKLEHFYDLANFYKDRDYFKDSIKYYSLALQEIDRHHHLFPKILDRRGSSYERTGQWEKAEKDLNESLKISPDEPYVLNYLAYSWIEKRINLDKASEMLHRAVKLKSDDGYIIDSLGWSYYVNKNYVDAEKFLQEAVKLKPLDPVINDHYADTLWMLSRKIQARYFWNYVLDLNDVEEKLRKKIKDKIILGIKNEL